MAESPGTLCQLLCALDKLIKEYLFGGTRQCGTDCRWADGDREATKP